MSSEPMPLQFEIHDLDSWIEKMEPNIDLLIVRMKRAGITMNEHEAYQYMCWCWSNAFQVMQEMAPEGTSDTMEKIMDAVSTACSTSYKQTKLNKLLPPSGPGISVWGCKSPEEWHARKQRANKAETTYTPGGYL